MIDLNFAPGDIVKVYQKIKEDSKIRTQIFEGTVLKIRGRGEDKTFTVRKIVADVAVERKWPLDSPSLEKVAVKSHPKKRVRRAKLTYLRKS